MSSTPTGTLLAAVSGALDDSEAQDHAVRQMRERLRRDGLLLSESDVASSMALLAASARGS
jgi:hypothetical protein